MESIVLLPQSEISTKRVPTRKRDSDSVGGDDDAKKKSRTYRLAAVLFFGLHPCPLNGKPWRDWRCAIAYSDAVKSQKEAMRIDPQLFEDREDRQKHFSNMVKRYFDGQSTSAYYITSTEMLANKFVIEVCGGNILTAHQIAAQFSFQQFGNILAHKYCLKRRVRKGGIDAKQCCYVMTAYTYWGKVVTEKFSWQQMEQLVLTSSSSNATVDEQLVEFCCGGAVKVADGQCDINQLLCLVANETDLCLHDQITGETTASGVSPPTKVSTLHVQLFAFTTLI